MIIQQVASVSAVNITVADDRCVLLNHFVSSDDIAGLFVMLSPIRGRTAIDENESVDNNHPIMDGLLAAHGLTGCDMVATYHSIRKRVAIKVLGSEKRSLSKVGDIALSVEEVLVQ